MAKLESVNPSNYKKIGEVDVSTPEEIAEKIELAHTALPAWRNLGLQQRIVLLGNALEDFKKRKNEIAELEAKEMGMPITDALADMDGNYTYFQWYLDNATKYLIPETTFESSTEIHQVVYEPIGVAAVIVPWNFPFANFVWGAVQSLLVGNTVVFKHSEETPLSGKLIEEVLTKHLPAGVFNEVYGDAEVGKLLVDGKINMVAFTGGTKTGKSIFEVAGKKFIKTVMELGGSAPGIIFEDADIDKAVGNICMNRLLNQGQCCDGLKRLIVHETKFTEVVEKLKLKFIELRIGDATDKKTQIGPLVAKRQLDLLTGQVVDSIAAGATIVTGGHSLESELGGAYYEPTILTKITPEMRVWTEEVFGPVLPIMTFSTDEEAIALANNTQFGLGSYIYTKDLARAEKVATAIEAGMVSINATNYVQPWNPFGGYKNSGFGREHGQYGFHDLTQIKVIAKNK